jgi:arylsulfatase A-like enzyme
MNQYWVEATRVAAALTVGLLVVAQGALAQTARPKIVHDSEYYILEAQHGQKWAAEDKALDAKLAELRSKFGAPPNIIHIMFDDTPVGDIGIRFIQKQRGWETPNMNRLADEGINFARLYTEPSCTPSRAALMTGGYAVRTGNGSMPIDTPRYGLVQWEQTMAEVLSDAGYATGVFGKWHLGRTEGRYPTDQGFDEWFGIPNSSDEAFWPDSSMYRPESDPVAGPEYLMESTKGQALRKLKIYDLAQRRIVDRELTGKAKDFIARQVKVATGTGPVEQWSIPRLFNLNLDPREEHSLSYGAQHAWVVQPAGKILADHQESLKQYPPIPPGAPDPYVPPVRRKP